MMSSIFYIKTKTHQALVGVEYISNMDERLFFQGWRHSPKFS